MYIKSFGLFFFSPWRTAWLVSPYRLSLYLILNVQHGNLLDCITFFHNLWHCGVASSFYLSTCTKNFLHIFFFFFRLPGFLLFLNFPVSFNWPQEKDFRVQCIVFCIEQVREFTFKFFLLYLVSPLGLSCQLYRKQGDKNLNFFFLSIYWPLVFNVLSMLPHN